jgi:hypothetical protein
MSRPLVLSVREYPVMRLLYCIIACRAASGCAAHDFSAALYCLLATACYCSLLLACLLAVDEAQAEARGSVLAGRTHSFCDTSFIDSILRHTCEDRWGNGDWGVTAHELIRAAACRPRGAGGAKPPRLRAADGQPAVRQRSMSLAAATKIVSGCQNSTV